MPARSGATGTWGRAARLKTGRFVLCVRPGKTAGGLPVLQSRYRRARRGPHLRYRTAGAVPTGPPLNHAARTNDEIPHRRRTAGRCGEVRGGGADGFLDLLRRLRVGGEGKLADDERYLIVGELAAEQGNQRNVVVLRLYLPAAMILVVVKILPVALGH